MRKIFCVIALFAFTCSLFAQEQTDRLMAILKDKSSDKVLVASHRGDWRNAPENSLQAFKNCIDKGVDMIEIDLKKTKDNQLVLMHDWTIDRTTDGKGKVEDYTLEELHRFHLKNGMGRVTFHQIPTLEEVLNLTKGKILINIDKGYDYFKEVYELLVKTNTVGQVIVKSSYPYEKVAAENGDVLNKVVYMPVVNLNKSDAAELIEGYRAYAPVVVECCLEEATSEALRLIQKIEENGSKVWINSLWPSLNAGHDDDRAVELEQADESWGWILGQGATVIQTDRPYELIQYLQQKGRR